MNFSTKKLISTFTISAILLSAQNTFANPYDPPGLAAEVNTVISISEESCAQLENTWEQRIASHAKWMAEVYKGERPYDQTQDQIYTRAVKQITNMRKRKGCF